MLKIAFSVFKFCYNQIMIKKVVKKSRLKESKNTDLEYWLQKPPEERVAAVDYLRSQIYGNSARLQRVARVIQRSSS
jgi:hypothetical protein